jgi:hypothetical protein
LHLTLGSSALLALAACGEKAGPSLVCADPDTMTSAEESVRRTLNYVEAAADPAQVCAGCEFFSGGATGSGCGSCTMFGGGPVNPNGHCDSWSRDA